MKKPQQENQSCCGRVLSPQTSLAGNHIMTTVVRKVNSISEHVEPIPTGVVKLEFAVRSKRGNRRTVIVGFMLSGDVEKRMVYCDETELLNFQKFQMRLLSIRGGLMVDHPAAKSQDGKLRWYEQVLAAIRAGEDVDAVTQGFRVIGGEA